MTTDDRAMEPCPLCAYGSYEEPCRECRGTGEVPVRLLPQRGIQANPEPNARFEDYTARAAAQRMALAVGAGDRKAAEDAYREIVGEPVEAERMKRSWWRGWLDPRDVDSWLMLLIGIGALVAGVLFVVKAFR